VHGYCGGKKRDVEIDHIYMDMCMFSKRVQECVLVLLKISSRKLNGFIDWCLKKCSQTILNYIRLHCFYCIINAISLA